MTDRELVEREERARTVALVIAETEQGFRVYSPADPGKTYLVTGLPERPECSCPDFRLHRADPTWCCKHILAVSDRFFGGNGAPEDRYDAEERAAIQEEGRPPRRNGTPSANGMAQMLLKRSASPDGRIDSLSVEFSCPVDEVSASEIKAKAKLMLALQASIISDFVGPKAAKNGGAPANGSATNGSKSPAAAPARLVAIGGMDGKWGRRLFIAVEVGDTTTRLFGNKKQLGEALVGAGYPAFAGNIAEGVQLNVPCQVVTKPSADGRYLDVVEVRPPEMVQGSGR